MLAFDLAFCYSIPFSRHLFWHSHAFTYIVEIYVSFDIAFFMARYLTFFYIVSGGIADIHSNSAFLLCILSDFLSDHLPGVDFASGFGQVLGACKLEKKQLSRRLGRKLASGSLN